MTNLPDRLKSHLAKMAAGDISDSTTHRLMALLRQLLEERNEKHRYPITAMFCDWSLHVKLDRSKPASTLLDLLDGTWSTGNVDQAIQNIGEGLSVGKRTRPGLQLSSPGHGERRQRRRRQARRFWPFRHAPHGHQIRRTGSRADPVLAQMIEVVRNNVECGDGRHQENRELPAIPALPKAGFTSAPNRWSRHFRRAR